MNNRINYCQFVCCSLVTFVIFAVLPLRVSAQSLAQQDDRAEQAQIHMQSGTTYFQSQDYSDALQEFEEARTIFHDLGDPLGEASALRSIGTLNQHIGNLEAAIDAYTQSLPLWDTLGEIELVAGTHNAIAYSNLGLGEMEEAESHFLDSLKRIDPETMSATRAEALSGLGFIDLQESRPRIALYRFETALSIWQELKQTENVNNTLTYIVDAASLIAQDEQSHYRYQEALAHYQHILSIYRALRDRVSEAWALNEIGGIYKAQAEYELARDTFGEVLSICRKQKMRGCEINVSNNLGEAYDHLTQYQEALKQHQFALELCLQERDCIETKLVLLYSIGRDFINLEKYSDAQDKLDAALKMAQDLPNHEMEGQVLTALAELDGRQAKYTNALSKQQSALTIFEEISYSEGQLTILGNMGVVYQEQGQLQNAEEQYLRALELARSIQDIEGEATAQGNLGSVYQEMGRYEDALRACRLALGFWQKSDVVDSQATIYNLMGAIYDDLGQYENALEQYNAALTIRRKSDRVSDEATTLNNIGVTYLHLQNYTQALPAFQEALTLTQALDLPAIQRYALDNLGFTYAKLGNYETALARHNEALTISRQIEDQMSEGVSLHNIGTVYSELQQPQRALDNLMAAYTLFSTTLQSDFQAQTLNDIGRVYQQQGELTKAIQYYKQALEATDLIRQKLKIEEFATSFSAERMTVYDRLIDALLTSGDPKAAFEYSEQARARVFLDQIGNQELDFHHRAAKDLIEEEQTLRQQIIGLKNALNNEQARSSSDVNSALIDSIKKELELARKQHEQLIPQLKLSDPEYAALVTIDTLKLEEIQSAVVDSATTLIEYYVMDEYTVAWIINRESVDFVQLNISRKELTDQIQYLTNLIKEKDFDFDSADTLYHTLFAPLLPFIKYPNLLIIPHGVLHYLPFAALWDAQTQHYLVQDYALTYAPSASALKLISAKRNPNQNRLLAMGNPDKSLDNAEIEVQQIAQLFSSQPLTQTQASESQLYSQSTQIDILHLAAHGIYDPYNALYTRIELAADASNDGNLEVHEIYGMDLSNTNLIVLSACNTSLSAQSTGDELTGLTRAFLYAGSPAIITTLWSINDEVSGVLMESFYRNLRSGMTNAAALRAAQQKLLQQKKWNTPYYWAAFNLTGDYGGGKSSVSMIDNPENNIHLVKQVWNANHYAEAFAYAEKARIHTFLHQVGTQRINYLQNATPAVLGQDTLPTQLHQKAEIDELYQRAIELLDKGEYQAALNAFLEVQAVYHELQDLTMEADVWTGIGIAYFQLGQLQESQQAQEHALALAKEANSLQIEADALSGIGDVQKQLKLTTQAISTYLQVLELRRNTQNAWGEGDTLSKLASVYEQIEDYNRALAIYQESLAVLRNTTDRDRQSIVLNRIGGIFNTLGRYDEALTAYQESLSIAIENDDKDGQGIAYNNIGTIYLALGDYGNALQNFQQALGFAQQLDRREEQGIRLNNIALVMVELGRFEDALELYQQSLEIAEEGDDPDSIATSYSNIAGLYQDLGRHEDAIEFYQKALTIFRGEGESIKVSTVQNNLGIVFEQIGRTDEAMQLYQESLQIARTLEVKHLEMTTLINIASLQVDSDHFFDGLTLYFDALLIASELGAQPEEKIIQEKLATFYIALRQLEQIAHFAILRMEAIQSTQISPELSQRLSQLLSLKEQLQIFEFLLATVQEIDFDTVEATTVVNLALLYEKHRNEPSKAIAYYQQAIRLFEQMQQSARVEELKITFNGQNIDLYKNLVNLLWQYDQLDIAFEYVERAKAKSFLDQIGNQHIDFRRAGNLDLLQEETRLKSQISDARQALSVERAKPTAQQDLAQINQLMKDLEELQNRYEFLILQIKLFNPEYASLLSVDVPKLESVQQTILEPSTTLIEYFVMDNHTLVWVIDKEQVDVVNLSIEASDLIKQIQYLHDLSKMGDFDDEVSEALYKTLFAPLKQHIRHNNLIIVPHDALHYLPFVALKDSETEHYLIQDYIITYAPSASILKFILDKRNPNQNRLLVMGDPDRSLPNTESEVQSIAQLFNSQPLLGAKATESQIYSQSSQIDILHMAAHGIYDPVAPLYTRIELAADASNDGNLEVHEVYGLDLTNTNLVVLSACDTALGQQSKGDELVGLTRAFLYAGSPAVVTTLWSINDDASGALMESFYRHLQEGMGNAEALRAAQLEVMTQEKWQSPYYWAAFELTGDYLGRE